MYAVRMSTQTLLCTLTLAVGMIPVAFEAQQSRQTEPPHTAAVGEISRVDKLLKSFELRATDEKVAQPNVLTDGIRIGTKVGNEAPRGSVRPAGLPQDPFDPRSEPSPDEVSRDTRAVSRANRTTVFLTESTQCKERTKVILCSELKVTDSVRVTGDERTDKRGKGLYAVEIIRNPLR